MSRKKQIRTNVTKDHDKANESHTNLIVTQDDAQVIQNANAESKDQLITSGAANASKSIGVAKYLTLGAMFVGAATFEIGYSLATGKSFFLGTLNQAGDALRSVDRFKEFFETNPVGVAVENTLNFLGSKPVKRIIRAVTMATALIAVDIATTGGAITAAGVALSCTGMIVNSIREYHNQSRMQNKLAESMALEELRKELTIQNTRFSQNLSWDKKKIFANFILGIEDNKNLAATPPTIHNKGFFSKLKEAYEKNIPKYYRDGIKAFGENLLETGGALSCGNIREFAFLLGMGTYKDIKFKYDNDLLKDKLTKAIAADQKQIGQLFGISPFKYKSIHDIKKAMETQKALVQILEANPTFVNLDPTLLKQEIQHKYKEIQQSDKEVLLNERNKMTFFEKSKKVINSVANAKFIAPVIGYFKMWVPINQYNPEVEIKSLHERRFEFNNQMDKLVKPSNNEFTKDSLLNDKATKISLSPDNTPNKVEHAERDSSESVRPKANIALAAPEKNFTQKEKKREAKKLKDKLKVRI